MRPTPLSFPPLENAEGGAAAAFNDDYPDGRLFPYANRWRVYAAIDAIGVAGPYRPHMNRRGFATALKDEGADGPTSARPANGRTLSPSYATSATTRRAPSA